MEALNELTIYKDFPTYTRDPEFQKHVWEEFVLKYDYSKYRDRGHTSDYLMKLNVFSGKMAEYGASDHFASLGYPRIEPDLKIYKGRQKSWASDLPYADEFPDLNLPNVAVKSCISGKYSWGESWCFQLSDLDRWGNPTGTGRDNVLDWKDNELVCLVCADKEKFSRNPINLEIRAIIPCGVIGENQHLLKPPRKPQYENSKVYLYWEDIEKYLKE